ncbi:MAG: asparagine synthase (glutamine-hydrolyzing) [Phycisphaerales bacterium JB040]
MPEESIPEDWLDELEPSVAWRGPDGSGRFRDRCVRPDGAIVDIAMVHHRLAILDLAGGGQPMVSEGPTDRVLDTLRDRHLIRGTGRVAVAFNGHVCNHRALRDELEQSGHAFVSDHADTEVFPHAWRAWGAELPTHLEGMFAAALWDGALGELALMRDRFGEKPLYVSGEPEHRVWLAGSNAAGLRRLVGELGGPTGISPENLTEWLSLGYHAEQMPFPGVVQLPPGSLVTAPAVTAIDHQRLYKKGLAGRLPGDWSRSRPRIEGRRAALRKVDDALRSAVERRLEADVPVGCFLSGGIDSSLIAHHAAALLRERGRTLTTVCVRMPDPKYDESERAEATARALGASHRTIDAEPMPAEDLVLLIRTLGLPLGDSSLLPTFWACQAAAREVGVALSGDGGDELFLGYERYRGATWLSSARLLGPFEFLLPRRDPKSRWTKLARLIEASKGRGYRDLLAIFPVAQLRPLLGLTPIAKPGLESDTPESYARLREYDLRHHLPGDLLLKVDTASMLAGLEVRTPFLDSGVARTALGLGVSRVRMNNRPKGVLRALVRRHLGPELAGRAKMGFAVPIGRWFREDYGGLGTLLNDHLRSADPFPGLPLDIQRKRVQRLLDEHELEQREHGQRLYALLVLSIWAHAEAV